MISTEVKQRLADLIEKSRQRELAFLDMLGKVDYRSANRSKPRVRVKAISDQWPTRAPSKTSVAREL